MARWVHEFWYWLGISTWNKSLWVPFCFASNATERQILICRLSWMWNWPLTVLRCSLLYCCEVFWESIATPWKMYTSTLMCLDSNQSAIFKRLPKDSAVCHFSHSCLSPFMTQSSVLEICWGVSQASQWSRTECTKPHPQTVSSSCVPGQTQESFLSCFSKLCPNNHRFSWV